MTFSLIGKTRGGVRWHLIHPFVYGTRTPETSLRPACNGDLRCKIHKLTYGEPTCKRCLAKRLWGHPCR